MDLLAELELHLLAGLAGLHAATAVLVHDAPAVLVLDARLPGLALLLRLDSFTVVGGALSNPETDIVRAVD